MAKVTPVPKVPGNSGNIRTMPVKPGGSPAQKVADYATGKKHYGTGRSMPNIGKTANKAGYAMRDAKADLRKKALLRRAGN